MTREEIIQALHDKNVNNPCPRCSSMNFEVVGQTLLSLSEPLNSLEMSDKAIPAAVIACSQCGFLTLHATVLL